MNESQSKKEYTAADIERYHNGSMPPEEAHALERAALDDPFLSDAIDGYVHTATPAADIAFLKQQLQRRSGKVIALPKSSRSIWLRIAAMVVLVAGFGWMVYKLSGKTEYDLAVQTNAPSQSEAQPIPQQPAMDSVAAGSEEMVAAAPLRNPNEEKAVVKKEPAAAKEVPKMMSREAVSSRPVMADTIAVLETQEAAPLSMKAMAKQAPRHTFKAYVIDTSGNPVPFATIIQTGTQNATQADAVGAFSITAPDSSLTVAVNAAGYQSQQTTLNPNDSNATIALVRGEGSLQEVVVTAMGKKAAKQKEQRSAEASRNKLRLESVEPLSGWIRLNAYVTRNATLPSEDADLKNNEVVLSFDVDKDGNAIDITVEKSLCPSCDATAVRIIKEGSKWKKKEKTARAKAHIRF